mgnify:CR=1 FL=1
MLENMPKEMRAKQDTDKRDERYICVVIKDNLERINETLYVRQLLSEVKDIMPDSTPNAVTEDDNRNTAQQDPDY